jgi:uncharacterized small protein (DUF1192 family)
MAFMVGSAIIALPLSGSLPYVVGIARTGRNGDMALFDEELPKKKKAGHEIGEDLAKLSVDELVERIGLLRAEVERLEEAIRAKRASADAAQSFFKR